MPKDNEEKTVSDNRKKKEVIVEEIKQKLDSATSIVLTDYQGLTHKQIEEFKKQLKTVNSTFAITKNTLLKISLSTSKIFADKVNDEALNAPTATVFISGDPIESLKILQKLAKETGLPKLKVGVIDGESLDQSQLIKLSTLPNKQTLLAQLVGLLNSPIQGLVVVLNANIQNLAMVLNAIAQAKPAEAAPAPVQAETPVAAETQTETPAAPVEAEASETPAVEEASAPTPDEGSEAAEVVETASNDTQNTVSEGGENS